MKLLVFAHRKEAEAFIDRLSFRPVAFSFEGLYQNSENFLLVTGEGHLDALSKTVATISSFSTQIEEIINIGIAGALNEKLKKGDILKIRTSYAYLTNRPEFKSYTSINSSTTVDCITANERIVNFENKIKLAPFADVIDRELWGIATAAQLLKKKFSAIKYISDELKDEDFCKLVINEAELISFKLLNYFLNEKNDVTQNVPENILTNSEIFNYQGLYFTLTLERRLEHLLSQLKHQNFTQKEFLNRNTDILNTELSPKEKTKKVLEALALEINPINKEITSMLGNEIIKFKKIGINASFDKNLESNSIFINVELKNNNDKNSFIKALETYNFEKIESIFQGKLDV